MDAAKNPYLRYTSKKTLHTLVFSLHTVVFSQRLFGTAAIKLSSNNAQIALKTVTPVIKLLSQLFYSTCWLCTCEPYIQVLIVLSTLVIIAKTPLWALPALSYNAYALVKGWSKDSKRTVRPEFFYAMKTQRYAKFFFDVYRTYLNIYLLIFFQSSTQQN